MGLKASGPRALLKGLKASADAMFRSKEEALALYGKKFRKASEGQSDFRLNTFEDLAKTSLLQTEEGKILEKSITFRKLGKWMFHLTKQELEHYWQICVKHFEEGDFSDLVKVMRRDPRPGYDDDSYCLWCFVGPSEDKELVSKVGRKLMKIFNHKGYIFYKLPYQKSVYKIHQ